MSGLSGTPTRRTWAGGVAGSRRRSWTGWTCPPAGGLWAGAGLDAVAVQAIEVPTVFADFDNYWQPFLGGQGPAPGYAMSLPEERRQALGDLLRDRLPSGPDGSIPLTARAWAVRGLTPMVR